MNFFFHYFILSKKIKNKHALFFLNEFYSYEHTSKKKKENYIYMIQFITFDCFYTFKITRLGNLFFENEGCLFITFKLCNQY